MLAFGAVRYYGWNQCAFQFIAMLEGVGLLPDLVSNPDL